MTITATIDHTAAQLALRTQLLTLEVAATGSMSLSCTTSTFVRATGSFLTDGFAVGMEVVAAGFSAANNGATVIVGLTATVMTVSKTLTAETAASARSLTAGLPATRGHDNAEVTPIAGVPYVEEEYVPGSADAMGPHLTDDTGLYVVRWYGVSNTGVGSISRSVDALLEHFTRGDALSMSDGNFVRVRGRPAPFRGPVRQASAGWAVCTVSIPWRIYTMRTS